MSKSTSISTSLIPDIYRSRNILLEILEEQGFNVSDYNEFSNNEIHIMTANNQLDMILSKEDDEEDESVNTAQKMYVKYHLGKTLRQPNIQEYVDDLFNIEEVLTKKDTLLIICKDQPTDNIIDHLKYIWETEGIFITIINLQRLLFNILKHALVPPHKVLNKRETDEIMKRYNISDIEKFPEISRFDPVSMVIGIRPGQVCEITRPSTTAVQTKYYRVCINKQNEK